MTLYDDIYEIASDNYGLITSEQAREISVSDKEMSRLTKDGRLRRLGRGVYRIKHYAPSQNDPYAEAVALVGSGSYLYGESVIAMHELAPSNPARIFVATPNRVRKKLPSSIRVLFQKGQEEVVEYEGIPSQTITSAILSCRETVMSDRLISAARNARNNGLITRTEEHDLLKELDD